MSIDRFPKKRWVSLAVFLFLTFLYSTSYPLDSREQVRAAADIKKEGIELYQAGQYVKAIETFKQIWDATGEKAFLSQAHLYISMSYYCLWEYEKAKKSLELSLEIMPEIDSSGIVLPPGYEGFFSEVKASRTGVRTEKETKEPVVRTEERKGGSNKTPLLIIAGVAVGAGILAAVLVLG